MAKAVFHKNQRVFVKPVGTWALVERVVPHWTKGLDEPLRIHYDVGLGREFSADELQAEQAASAVNEKHAQSWRIARARNKWQPPEDCQRHPVPGTFPIVITGEQDWGGWRVPGAEYDIDPERIERQARLIATAPQLENFAQEIVEWARTSGEDLPDALMQLARSAQELLTRVNEAEPYTAQIFSDSSD